MIQLSVKLNYEGGILDVTGCGSFNRPIKLGILMINNISDTPKTNINEVNDELFWILFEGDFSTIFNWNIPLNALLDSEYYNTLQ